MKNLMNKSMNKNIKELGLNPDNVEWGCYYHTNTAHPHIHAFIFEKIQQEQITILKKYF